MRPVTLVMLALTACQTEVIELLPDRQPARDSAAEVRGDVRFDVRPDRPSDTTPPDTQPQCVCRYNFCRDTPQCQSLIDAASVCQVGGLCSGAKGSCKLAADCGAPSEWICVIGPSSQTPCF